METKRAIIEQELTINFQQYNQREEVIEVPDSPSPPSAVQYEKSIDLGDSEQPIDLSIAKCFATTVPLSNTPNNSQVTQTIKQSQPLRILIHPKNDTNNPSFTNNSISKGMLYQEQHLLPSSTHTDQAKSCNLPVQHCILPVQHKIGIPAKRRGINKPTNFKFVSNGDILSMAKSIFFKRTCTLYQWMYPNASREQVRMFVATTWDNMTDQEKNIYIAQVMDRCNKMNTSGSLMVNPQLSQIKYFPTAMQAPRCNRKTNELQNAISSISNETCDDALQITLKAIVNHKKLKHKAFLKQLVIEELRSACYGVLLANIFLAANCILCKLTGGLHYYNIGLISGFISGLSVLIETNENHRLDTLIFSNCLVEAMFKNIDAYNILKLTKARETLLFMGVSSLLMHLLQNKIKSKNYGTLWFYSPKPFTYESDAENTNEKCVKVKCDHQGQCLNFAVMGGRKYFVLGLLFSIVRKFIPKMLIIFKKPSELYKILVNKEHLKFGAFIGSYVAIYRYVTCFLIKKHNHVNQKYFGAVAGLFSGLTYAISPNIQVMSVGVTTILQIFYNNILSKLNIKNKLVPQQIVYMMSHGLLAHNAIMSKETCPSYYVNMLDTCTSNVFLKIYQELVIKYIL
ncbi:transmembrane protein 135-like isoform X2 [Anthonomus grandis grandis]|uniref:transmembrane protein 135-like isoform X2 n=1 Tax=Anthonomus grandis grandis TaxID=2921223 RepID=UPI0021650B02|nr:transmembrane protein 135-like isoform X2 [Anthonomus grandis grandis]